MKLLKHPSQATSGRRGAVLMLSFLVLIVLILIVQQISYSSKTDARVARNEETLAAMDQAIESVLLEVYETLIADAQGGGAAGGDPFGGAAAGGGGDPFGGAGGEGEGGDGSQGPVDSKEDEWARPIRTEMNELQLRALIQDEDSKFNVLSILSEDPEDAEKAFDRLTRVIENARKDTRLEIDGGRARQIADAMREFMQRRDDQVLPRPRLLTDETAIDEAGLPMTLREFVGIDAELFSRDLFRDVRDEDGTIVHSLGTFLTVTSSLSTLGASSSSSTPPGVPPSSEEGEEPETGAEGERGAGSEEGGQPDPAAGMPGAGGGEADSPDGRINLNTAPRAVLDALMDQRGVPYDFWPDVIEYRNEPAEEEDEDLDDSSFQDLDEYGEEIVPKQFFSSVDDLSEIKSWVNFEPEEKDELTSLLKTQSSVFSIFVTARRPSGAERIERGSRREDIEREEAEGQGLVRTVRSVVWRRVSEDGEAEIIPIIRWEVLDYVPYEVLDFPDEDR